MKMIFTAFLSGAGFLKAPSTFILPRPGDCEFETQLRRTFFPAYFRLSPLL